MYVKGQRGPSPVNTVVKAWLQFCFRPKTHVQASMCELVRYHGIKSMIGFSTTLCVSDELLQDFGALLQGGTTYWPYDLVARIHDAPRHCNWRKQWVQPLHLAELDVLFLVLALLDASIGMIGLWLQCHSHTPMIRHQLWDFWANLNRRQHLLSDVRAKLLLLKI